MAKTQSAEGADKAPPDWDLIEIEYRAGVKTLRQIAEKHGITHGAVNKRAKARGWTRDLAAKIQAQADAKVSKAAVSEEVSKAKLVTESLIVEANAEAIAQVRLAHRSDIQRSRRVGMALLEEMEASCGPEQAALLMELGEMMRKPDDNGVDKLNDIYMKIVALPGRAKTMKDLGETLRVLVDMERKAFGLDEPPAGPMAGTLTDEQRAVLQKALDGSY